MFKHLKEKLLKKIENTQTINECGDTWQTNTSYNWGRGFNKPSHHMTGSNSCGTGSSSSSCGTGSSSPRVSSVRTDSCGHAIPSSWKSTQSFTQKRQNDEATKLKNVNPKIVCMSVYTEAGILSVTIENLISAFKLNKINVGSEVINALNNLKSSCDNTIKVINNEVKKAQ